MVSVAPLETPTVPTWEAVYCTIRYVRAERRVLWVLDNICNMQLAGVLDSSRLHQLLRIGQMAMMQFVWANAVVIPAARERGVSANALIHWRLVIPHPNSLVFSKERISLSEYDRAKLAAHSELEELSAELDREMRRALTAVGLPAIWIDERKDVLALRASPLPKDKSKSKKRAAARRANASKEPGRAKRPELKAKGGRRPLTASKIAQRFKFYDAWIEEHRENGTIFKEYYPTYKIAGKPITEKEAEKWRNWCSKNHTKRPK